MRKTTVTRLEEAEPYHRDKKAGFESYTRGLTPMDDKARLFAMFVTLPPGQSYCPFHWHASEDELFCIISGKGLLRTPEGEREVTAGDTLYFPAGEGGAHRLKNASDTEDLVYLDVDSVSDPSLCFYPDSGKIGAYSSVFDGIYRLKDEVGYYEGE